MVKVRKQVYDLTLADFEQYPAWEFCLDEEGEDDQDEATVRPIDKGEYDADTMMGVVKAKFKLSGGAEMSGYLTPVLPDEESDLGSIQPSIVTSNGQVAFWFGVRKLSPKNISEFYRVLGISPKEVFPLTYQSDFPISTGPIKGTIEGFMHYNDDQKIAVLR